MRRSTQQESACARIAKKAFSSWHLQDIRLCFVGGLALIEIGEDQNGCDSAPTLVRWSVKYTLPSDMCWAYFSIPAANQG